MKPLHLTTFSILLPLLPLILSQSTTPGELAFFLDYGCDKPTTLLPTYSLPLSTCLVPHGAVAASIASLSPCDDGSTATMIMYLDASCVRDAASENVGTDGYSGWETVPNCFYKHVSSSIPGLMFTCQRPEEKPRPTATVTIDVTRVAGVATVKTGSTTGSTGAPAGTGSGGGGSGGAEDDGGGSSQTPGGTANTDSAGDKEDSDSGLSRSDKIAIGVGLGVGLPTIIITLAAWCWPR